MSALTNEQELAAIRARHGEPVPFRYGMPGRYTTTTICKQDHDPWPCDTAQVLAALDAATRRETELVAALSDILDLSKGEPKMSGGSLFTANAHRMGRIHNRARRAFGEEPLTILEPPAREGQPYYCGGAQNGQPKPHNACNCTILGSTQP